MLLWAWAATAGRQGRRGLYLFGEFLAQTLNDRITAKEHLDSRAFESLNQMTVVSRAVLSGPHYRGETVSLRTLVQLSMGRAMAPPGVVVAPGAVAMAAPFTARALPVLDPQAASCRRAGTGPWMSRAAAP
jgi:hypothetical protein